MHHSKLEATAVGPGCQSHRTQNTETLRQAVWIWL